MKDLAQVKDLVSKSITLGDILKVEGRVSLNLEEEQLKCPFHGRDSKPSARYYRNTDSMYCWYCKERWDIYKYIGQRDNLNFKESLNYILKKYQVDISSLPDVLDPENLKNKRVQRKSVTYDRKKLFFERARLGIVSLKDKIEVDKYKRLVYAFMILKYTTPEDKFQENAEKLSEVLSRLLRSC